MTHHAALVTAARACRAAGLQRDQAAYWLPRMARVLPTSPPQSADSQGDTTGPVIAALDAVYGPAPGCPGCGDGAPLRS